MVEEEHLDDMNFSDEEGAMNLDDMNMQELSLAGRLKSKNMSGSSDGNLRRMNNMLQDKKFLQVLDE